MKNGTSKTHRKTVRIIVRVEPDLAAWFATKAEQTDLSVGWLVRKALKRFQVDDKDGQLSFKAPELQLAGFAE